MWRARGGRACLQQRIEALRLFPRVQLLGARLDLGGGCRGGRAQDVVEDALGEGVGLAGHLDGAELEVHGGEGWVFLGGRVPAYQKARVVGRAVAVCSRRHEDQRRGVQARVQAIHYAEEQAIAVVAVMAAVVGVTAAAVVVTAAAVVMAAVVVVVVVVA